MRYRHVVAVDRVEGLGLRCDRPRREVGDDLVAEEVEVDPLLAAAPFGAADHARPEDARGVEVVDREGEVERWAVHGAERGSGLGPHAADDGHDDGADAGADRRFGGGREEGVNG